MINERTQAENITKRERCLHYNCSLHANPFNQLFNSTGHVRAPLGKLRPNSKRGNIYAVCWLSLVLTSSATEHSAIGLTWLVLTSQSTKCENYYLPTHIVSPPLLPFRKIHYLSSWFVVVQCYEVCNTFRGHEFDKACESTRTEQRWLLETRVHNMKSCQLVWIAVLLVVAFSLTMTDARNWTVVGFKWH